MATRQLFDHPSDFEPLLPEDRDGHLAALGLELLRRAERLRGTLSPVTRRSVAALVRSMNSYYSNLIEGHRTMPRDLDAALAHKFSSDTKRRALQQLHLAHVETQDWMEAAVDKMSAAQICSAEFLGHIHREFYKRLPAAFRQVESHDGKKHPVQPGELRSSEVSVGQHVPPASKHLDKFLRRFTDFYGPLVQPTPLGFVAAAAAHHRLAWIHPFLDGNGRVTRLVTHAWLRKAEADADGLWTLSRGFARRQTDYRVALAHADEKRRNDLDGRGHLSDRRLAEFCEFTLRTALDQLDFMRDLLELDGMSRRITGFAEREESAGDLPSGSALVLRAIFLRGEIPRGDVARIAAVSPRTGQTITRELLARRLILSDSPKGVIRLSFPADAASHYFPNLFPAGAE
jgi:Fic family protein